MRRWIVLLLAFVLFSMTILVVGFVAARRAASRSTVTVTSSPIPQHTATETSVPTETLTLTATDTTTPTLTETPTPTATLSTLVLQVTSVNNDVTFQPALRTLSATGSSTPLPTVNVPTPPATIALMPSAEVPMVGWFERDIADPLIQYAGKWNSFNATYRSVNHHYVYSDDEKARLSLRFLGAGVRLRYVAFYTYGIFEVRIDGQVVATIDSYYPKTVDGRGNFLSTGVYGLVHGWHTLEVIRLGRKNPASSGEIIAIDGIDLYLNGPEPTESPTPLPTGTATFTPSPRPAQKIEVVIAPPTIQPTATFVAPGIASVNLSIAYDENNNKAVDPDEGVQGLSVRLVTADTNQVVASGFTNNEGYAHLEAVTNAPLRLVVPYLNKYWDVPARSSNLRITLLIPPANQPGLIP